MQCTATSKQTGNQCKRSATPGHRVCKAHGSGSPQARKAAERRLTETAARNDAVRFGARRDLHPADALLELVQHQAGIVDYWRTHVQDIEHDNLIWGTTRVKTGGDDHGHTEEAKPNIAYTLLREAQHDLAAYAAAALKAGVEERKVRLAEAQGALVGQVIRRILDRLNLTPDQQTLVGTVVPAELRALTTQETP